MDVVQISRGILVVCAGTILLAGCSGGGSAAGSPAYGAPSIPAASTGDPITAPSGAGPTGAASGSLKPPAEGGSIGHAVTDPDQLSSLLGPGDFSAVGVAGAGEPTVNGTEPGAVAAVYSGASGATGGIELDVVVGDSPTGMGDVFASMAAPLLDFEGKGRTELPMADDAQVRTDNPLDSGGTWAGIAVQKGRLVFLISIPGSPAAEGQLVSLAKLVLERAGSLE